MTPDKPRGAALRDIIVAVLKEHGDQTTADLEARIPNIAHKDIYNALQSLKLRRQIFRYVRVCPGCEKTPRSSREPANKKTFWTVRLSMSGEILGIEDAM